MAEQALAKATPLDSMKALFEKHKPQLKDLLPVGVTEKEVIQSAIQACRENPTLLECTPQSMLGAVAKCCQLGLPPADGTHRTCIVPFRNNKKNCMEAQLMIEYRGLIYLMQNISNITPNNQVVCEFDTFDYELGLNPKLVHKIHPTKRGGVIGAYAIFAQEGFPPIVEYMTRTEIDAIRARSRAKDSGPWVTDYDMMARKTVLRRAARLVPMATKRGELLQEAVLLDEKNELGIPQDMGVLADPAATGTVAVTNADKIAAVDAKATVNPSPTMSAPAGGAGGTGEGVATGGGVLTLGTTELNDVKAAFVECTTIQGATKVLTGLPAAWQEVSAVQKIYQDCVRAIRDNA